MVEIIIIACSFKFLFFLKISSIFCHRLLDGLINFKKIHPLRFVKFSVAYGKNQKDDEQCVTCSNMRGSPSIKERSNE